MRDESFESIPAEGADVLNGSITEAVQYKVHEDFSTIVLPEGTTLIRYTDSEATRNCQIAVRKTRIVAGHPGTAVDARDHFDEMGLEVCARGDHLYFRRYGEAAYRSGTTYSTEVIVTAPADMDIRFDAEPLQWTRVGMNPIAASEYRVIENHANAHSGAKLCE